jgi:hypothetical protein
MGKNGAFGAFLSRLRDLKQKLITFPRERIFSLRENEMRRLLLAAIALGVLGACSAELKGPRVQVTPSTVEFGPDAGGFCPPGQAKKGRC